MAFQKKRHGLKIDFPPLKIDFLCLKTNFQALEKI